MVRYVIFVVIFLFGTASLKAQSLQGIVYKLSTNNVLSAVEVNNIRTGEKVQTSALGNFTIDVQKGDRLSFSYPGYRVDTIVVTDMSLKRIYLTPLTGHVLAEVEITEMNADQLDMAIENARETGRIAGTGATGGLFISPSRIFGKEAKDARKRYRLLMEEKESRAVLAKFTPELVQSLTPLKGRQLDLFMVKYKPSYSFIQNADEAALRLYIIDAYRAFNKLSSPEIDDLKLKKE